MPFLTWPLAWLTGVPEPTLRLLFTILFGYPIARAYKHLYGQTQGPVSASAVSERNMFILLSGLALALFFNGAQIYHSLFTIVASYSMLYIVDKQKLPRQYGVAGVWVLNAVYLLGGYLLSATDDYDITWTMPQCILCLRLMGFSFDFLDGKTSVVQVAGPGQGEKQALRPTDMKKPPSDLPLSFANDTPLSELPEFLQVLAYCYFPSAFLVGPQFSFSLYRRWLGTSKEHMSPQDQEEWDKAQMRYVFRCFGLAFVYLLLQQTVGASYTTSYLLTDEYAALPLSTRIFTFLVAGKFVYSKYLGVWLLTEGACAYFGISYEGNDEEGNGMFKGLANTLPLQYETATSIDLVIGSFNINTNLWTKYYVFKRLRFLGNKQLSQFGALAFLALWHGFHANYFTTFLMEFLYVECERVLRQRLFKPVVQPYIKQNAVALVAWKAVAWLTCSMTLWYAVVQFDLLKLSKLWTAYKSVYFLGHLPIVILLTADKLLPKAAPIAKKTN